VNHSPFKQCSCGRQYSHAEYEALPAPSGGEIQDDGVEVLLYRQCECQSTMAVAIACRVTAYARDVLAAEEMRGAA
jgi:hypothetical protein